LHPGLGVGRPDRHGGRPPGPAATPGADPVSDLTELDYRCRMGWHDPCDATATKARSAREAAERYADWWETTGSKYEDDTHRVVVLDPAGLESRWVVHVHLVRE